MLLWLLAPLEYINVEQLYKSILKYRVSKFDGFHKDGKLLEIKDSVSLFKERRHENLC